MSGDITTRLRQTRADMIGTDDEEHYWDCHDAAAEIERLRITDAEREAIREAVRGYKFWALDHVVYNQPEVQAVLYRLNGLLERFG